MNPRIKSVVPNDDFTLTLTFTDDTIRKFDMIPYITANKYFSELSNIDYFNTVYADCGSICWKNGQDLCPDTLYLKSVVEVTALRIEE